MHKYGLLFLKKKASAHPMFLPLKTKHNLDNIRLFVKKDDGRGIWGREGRDGQNLQDGKAGLGL